MYLRKMPIDSDYDNASVIESKLASLFISYLNLSVTHPNSYILNSFLESYFTADRSEPPFYVESETRMINSLLKRFSEGTGPEPELPISFPPGIYLEQ